MVNVRPSSLLKTGLPAFLIFEEEINFSAGCMTY